MPSETVTSPPTVAALRADAFTAMNYHFGMLLGVEDFETQQAFVRGTSRIASAWQHGSGVVWGFGVSTDLATGALRVEPGLGWDWAGHVLHLDAPACVGLGRWAAKHRDELGLPDPLPDEVTVPALSVRVRFRACLARQVPAITTPCDGTATGTAYSRVVETVELTLEPGLAPTRPDPMAFHRLRLLFGIDEAHTDDNGAVTAEDQAVLDEIATIKAWAVDQQPAAMLVALRRFAGLDSVARRPAVVDQELLRYPAADDEGIVIAHLENIRFRPAPPESPADTAWTVLDAPVSVEVRPVLLDTTTIQELLCGPVGPTDAGGPRVIADGVIIEDQTITITLDKALDETSVSVGAVSVTALDANGWVSVEVVTVDFENANLSLVILLNEAVGDRLLRVVVRGTGPQPLLGVDAVPFAGQVGGPPRTQHDGADFAYQLDLRA